MASIVEEWRAIVGYDHYEVSSTGRVRSTQGGLLDPAPDASGYVRVGLTDTFGNKHKRRVHRLVAEAFCIKPSTSHTIVNHINNVANDNTVDNLAWVTYPENRVHAQAFRGLRPKEDLIFDISGEKWANVGLLPGLEGIGEHYEVSTAGRLRSLKRACQLIMAPNTTREGYVSYQLRSHGVPHTVKAHRLVAMAFVTGMSVDKPEVNHLDKNKKNNHYSNLEWCDSSINQTHASSVPVDAILESLRSDCESIDNIAMLHGVSRPTVAKIARKYGIPRVWQVRVTTVKAVEQVTAALSSGLSWEDVATKCGVGIHSVIRIAKEAGLSRQRGRKPKITSSTCAALKGSRKDGLSYQQLADKYGVSVTTAWKVVNKDIKGVLHVL